MKPQVLMLLSRSAGSILDHGRPPASGAPGQLQESPTIQSGFKRKLAIGTVAAAAAAFAGGAYASTKDPSGGSRQAFLTDVAKRLHVTPAQLDSALKGAALDELSAAVKEGRITQAQADALRQRIQKAGAHVPLPLGPGPGPGPGPGLGLGPGPGPEQPDARTSADLRSSMPGSTPPPNISASPTPSCVSSSSPASRSPPSPRTRRSRQ